jgi:hypothetical protein
MTLLNLRAQSPMKLKSSNCLPLPREVHAKAKIQTKAPLGQMQAGGASCLTEQRQSPSKRGNVRRYSKALRRIFI